jgi:hypothetical protein
VLAVIAGLVIWTPWASKVPASSVAYQQMRNSAAAAKSVHIKGAFIEKGQKLQIDVAGDRAGTNTRVIVDDGNGVLEILTVNGRFYLKADAAYWTKNGSAAAKVAAGKYVTVPAGSAAGMDVFKVGTLLDQILAKDMCAEAEHPGRGDRSRWGLRISHDGQDWGRRQQDLCLGRRPGASDTHREPQRRGLAELHRMGCRRTRERTARRPAGRAPAFLVSLEHAPDD